ncbi:hypothetical protein ACK377_12675 [Aeromonas veronii]
MTDGRQKQTLRIASASIAAILEKHKEGMSGRKIAELFKMGQRTVADIIAAVSESPESGKPLTPEDDLKPPCAKSGIPKMHNPEIYPSPLRATEGEA